MIMACYNGPINVDDKENEKKRLKSTPKVSMVWDFFEKLPCQQAKCKLCNKVMSHKPSGGTSHLKRHISLSCKKQLNNNIRFTLSANASTGGSTSLTNCKYDPDEFHRDIGVMSVDGQPYRSPNQLATAINIMKTSPPETPMQDTGSITIKATFGDDIIRFEISSSSTMVDLEEEVAKRLKLKVGSFNMKYMDEDSDWVLITCDADLWYCMRLLGRTTIKMVVLPSPTYHFENPE